jgi:Pin2-interacting protein X1
MLEKMGWKTGQGLGLNNDGTTSHIKIAVKDDNLGIGASQKDAETGWLNNSKSYQEVLDRLSKSCNDDFAEEVKKEELKKMKEESKEKKEKKEKKETKETKEKQKQKEKKEKEKKVKKEKISKKSKSDSTRDLNDSESLSTSTCTSTSKPTILKSAHRAKFIRNKAVSSYSEAHLKEILGGFNI